MDLDSSNHSVSQRSIPPFIHFHCTLNPIAVYFSRIMEIFRYSLFLFLALALISLGQSQNDVGSSAASSGAGLNVGSSKDTTSIVHKKHKQKHLPQTNLLFIMFDDLRPELSVYGKNHMITPNFERLAKKSVVFDIALAQVAVCNPSRNSILTGLKPDVTSNYNFQDAYTKKILPTYLVDAGYKTAGFGKILHWEKTPESVDKSVWSEEFNMGVTQVCLHGCSF